MVPGASCVDNYKAQESLNWFVRAKYLCFLLLTNFLHLVSPKLIRLARLCQILHGGIAAVASFLWVAIYDNYKPEAAKFRSQLDFPETLRM